MRPAMIAATMRSPSGRQHASNSGAKGTGASGEATSCGGQRNAAKHSRQPTKSSGRPALAFRPHSCTTSSRPVLRIDS